MNSITHPKITHLGDEDDDIGVCATIQPAPAYLNSLHTAVDHNNQGIEYLEHGLYEKSLQEFKKAAQMLHLTTQHLKENHNNVKGLPTKTSSYVQARQSIPTNNDFIRSTPLFLGNSNENMTTTTTTTTVTAATAITTSCTVESATVLLNMALCCHLDSVGTCSISDGMTNAIALYEMSYTLAVRCHYDHRSHPIILISLNNLGQLSHDVGDFGMSTRYLEELSSRVVHFGEAGEISSIDNPQDFLLNALVLRNSYHAAGAA